MYAAAGGASLASRQARQRQRQQKKTQQLQAKLHPPKAVSIGAAASEHGASTPTRQSRQFHQLPTNYLRAPQPQGRKLSATYTTQSKLLLPIDEGDTQSVLHMRMHSHAHMHHSHLGAQAQAHHHAHSHGGVAITAAAGQHSHQHTPLPSHYQQFASHGRVSPKLVHRHSGSSSTSFQPAHLPKSATATLPLVSQMEPTPPTTPLGAVGVKTTATGATIMTPPTTTTTSTTATTTAAGEVADEEFSSAAGGMSVPLHDAIIVTPATPMASPGHVAKLRPTEDLPEGAAERQPLTAGDTYDDEEPMQPPSGPLERKCSVYRMRRSDAFEYGEAGAGIKRQLRELQLNQQQQQYEPLLTDEPQLLFKGLPNGRKWQLCAYCEEGICVCEHIECAQGRAAWLERGRRCSVQESQQQATLSRRWVKRNRIQDASLGGSSDDEDFLGVLRGPSTFANAFLYVGLGTVALGLVIAFVGTGEKGFKTVELRLIGPSLIGIGLVCCILRILFCICPSHCISSNKKTRKKNGNKIDADHTTSLLRGESKRVSIARGPVTQPKYPIAHKRSQSKMLNEGMEALRQIATTSLFMQNEQKPSMNRIVPIIKEPENASDAPLEMKKLDTTINMCEMSDEEDADGDVDVEAQRHRSTDTQAATKATTTTAVTTKTSSTTNNTKIKFEGQLPSSAMSHKLARQRVALHQQHQQQQQQQSQQLQQQQKAIEQSQSLSSSSTVKDSFDGTDDLLMETSLMVLKTPASTTTMAEARPPAPPTTNPTSNVPPSSSAGAIPRLKSSVACTTSTSTPPPATTTTAMPTSTSASVLRPSSSTYSAANSSMASGGALPKTITQPNIGAHTGAISRIPTSMSHPTSSSYASSYDLPPAQPHTYAAAATVRGPLGMPLSALTASYSAYAMPATSSTATTATVSASSTASILAPTALLSQQPTMTAISLLPLPAPPASTLSTIAPPPSIPGQVIDLTPSSTAANLHQQLLRQSTSPQIATTSLSLLLPTTPAPTLARPSSLPPHQQPLSVAPASTSQQPPHAFSTSTSSNAYMFPAAQQMPQSANAASRSQPSSASSMGRMAISGISLLSPPPTTTPATKFEPELVLSPAKLGQ